MITLSTPTVDILGALELQNVSATSDISTTTRRVQRVPTLDGGVHITDLGFSDGDRTINVTINSMTQAQAASLLYLQTNYSQLIIVTRDGVFLGSLQQVNSVGSFVFLVSSKLS